MKTFLFALLGLVGAASMMAQIPQSKLDANALALGIRGTGGLPPEVIMAHGVIDPSGNLLINTKTGVVAIAANATIGGSSVVALGTITSTSANAFTVGPNGTTHPAFNIDDSGSTPGTGLNLVPAAAASGFAMSVISSGTNENGTFDAKGSGTLTFNGTATGSVLFGTTATANNATTPSFTTAAGKTNTGNVTINGKTSGSTKYTTADATLEAVTVTTAAQTVGNATATIPNMLGVSAGFSLNSSAVLTAGATPAFAPGASISMYTLTPGEDETWAATTTGAVAGKVYWVVITATSTSRTLTFGSNMISTGTLATGTDNTKHFVIGFIYNGTSFLEVSRTTAE